MKNVFFLFVCLSISLYCYSQEYQYKLEFKLLDTACTYNNPYIRFALQVENIGNEPFYLLKYTPLRYQPNNFNYFCNIFFDTSKVFMPKFRGISFQENKKREYVKLEKNMIYQIKDSINLKEISFDKMVRLAYNNDLFGHYSIQIVLNDSFSRVKKRLEYFETPIIRVRYKEEW